LSSMVDSQNSEGRNKLVKERKKENQLSDQRSANKYGGKGKKNSEIVLSHTRDLLKINDSFIGLIKRGRGYVATTMCKRKVK